MPRRIEELTDRDWLATRLGRGDTQAAVAQSLGCDQSTVSRAAGIHGLRIHRPDLDPDRVVDLYQQGHSLEAVAEQVSAGIRTVRRVLVDAGVPIRSRASRPAPLNDPSWLQQRHHGPDGTIGRIADELGCDPQTVRRALDRHHISRVVHDTAPDDQLRDHDWLAARYLHDRMSLADIAELVGRPRQSVSRALRRAGIPTRPAGSGTARPATRRHHR